MPIPYTPKHAETPADIAWFSDETVSDINRMARRFTPEEEQAVHLALLTMRRAGRLGNFSSRPVARFLLFKLMRELVVNGLEPRPKA